MGGVINVIESAVENVIESLIANQLHWNICSMPVSSDSCFECGDAIIHIDAKTIKDDNTDATSNTVNVEASQTTYAKGTPYTIARKTWDPKLNLYETHRMFGDVPNLTYIVEVIYSATNLVESIELISLPHGQLNIVFGGGNILRAGKNARSNPRTNIRFKKANISAVQPWRIKTIYKRQ